MFRIRDRAVALMVVTLGLLAGLGAPAPSQVKPKPPAGLKMTAEQLARIYLNDEKTFNASIKNKIMEIEGTIFTASPAAGARGIIFLNGAKKAGDKEGAAVNISCQLKLFYAEKALWLSKGQKVRVTGKALYANQLHVTLVDCDFTELSKPMTLTVAAEKLASEYDQDEAAAEKKYKGKELVVEGVVADLVFTGGIYQVKLAGPKPEVRVACGIREADFKKLKKEQKVSIKGECYLFLKEEKPHEVFISAAFVLTK